jgi:hypothetical protein
MDDFDNIARLIGALRPWLDELVFVGGWAHRLYRFHPLADPPAYLSLQTKDADLVFSAVEGDIGAALEDAGFREEFVGFRNPPATHYHLGNENQGFYAEFLVPLTGSRIERNGKPVPLTIKRAGVTAQRLRYLDLLLKQPWVIALDPSLGFELEPAAKIALPNPVSFIIQKMLIHADRSSAKQAQDALYIHDTLELFGGNLDELKEIWLDRIRPTLSRKTVDKIERLYCEQFETVTNVHRDAARIPQDRTLSPERVQVACSYGVGEILGLF